jgi:phage baseplate assembly protein V
MHSERDKNALRAMLRRAAIEAVYDAGNQQLLDLIGLASDKPRKVPRVESFGLASNPPGGGNGLIVCPGGRSDRAMFIGGEHADYRPKGQPSGGTTIYDANGQAISFVKNNIRIVGTQTITLTAPTFILNGDVFCGAQAGSQPVKLADGSAATKLSAI